MTIAEILVKAAAGLAARVVEKKLLTEDSNRLQGDFVNLQDQLSSHLISVANWSARIQFYGLGQPRDTDVESIRLNYHGTPRKFRAFSDGAGETRDEDTLLNDEYNYLLLGDPGAGKTTSLKRIARKLLQEPSETTDTYQYPILILLKEISLYDDICRILADILGFRVEEREITRIVKKEIDEEDDGNIIKKVVSQKETVLLYLIDGNPIDDFIPRFLNDTCAVILVDGLDELERKYIHVLQRDLEKLALKLSKAKIILTCRSGHYHIHKTLEGFNLLEILPLDQKQVSSLAALWINNVNEFLEELGTLPYKDLSDRPLLLTQLLFIYKRYGNLPKHPKEVYQLIIELLLREWDADRHIRRRSRYADFNAKRKAEFLAELAFHLMYGSRNMGKGKFSSRDLMAIYREIHFSYDLPPEQADYVVSEIETHTGIVVSSGLNEYEFSHLSLQEYLCADYIVRSPITSELVRLFSMNAEPVAIAVSLASDPTSWFLNLISDGEILDVMMMQMLPFVTRLVRERPIFKVDAYLGFSILRVFWKVALKTGAKSGRKAYTEFFSLRGIKESVNEFMLKVGRSASIVERKSDFLVKYEMRRQGISASFLIEKQYFRDFLDFFGIHLECG